MNHTDLLTTPLFDLHTERGGKMVPFAGYAMPVQYPLGIMKEHLHTRDAAGLFDVSHMGQALLRLKTGLGDDDAHQKIAKAIETLVPGEIVKLKKGGLRYSVLLNANGGVLDDLMITRPFEEERQGELYLVVNAATKADDFALLNEKLAGLADLIELKDNALIALQGPKAAAVLEGVVSGVSTQTFMTARTYEWEGHQLAVSRSGYTGEDGFEISVPSSGARQFAESLLASDDVEPIGLGARDSLRLEAGLCLYGHDMTPETTPVQGNISFAIGKRRRAEGGFPGADQILRELEEGATKVRVGLKPEGRAPAREGVEIMSADGMQIGQITSGGFGPSAEGPIAMGYVDRDHSATGTKVHLSIRGKLQPASVVDMPFVPHRYYRG
ncbi:MAG: glycine cleavage system aminomethyltransferase GcvT [Pseudomonadota bacterium]